MLMQSYIDCLEVKVDEDFMHWNGNFVNAYLSFWGNTARQLANERLIFEDFIEELKELQKNYKDKKYNDNKRHYFQELYYIIRAFTFNTLNANSSLKLLRSEIQEFVDETIMKYPEEWGIYINYSYVKIAAEQMIASSDKENRGEVIRRYTVLFILLFFIENILILEGKSKQDLFERQRLKVHGVGNFLDIMQQITKGNEMLVIRENMRDVSIQKFLYTYERVFEKTEILSEFDVLVVASVRKYLYALPATLDLEREKIMATVDSLYQSNPEWVKTMAVILSFCNEGVYSLDKKYVPSYRLSDEVRVYDEFYTDRIEDAKERFCDVICSDRIKAERKNKNNDVENKKKWQNARNDKFAEIINDLTMKREVKDLKSIYQMFFENCNNDILLMLGSKAHL